MMSIHKELMEKLGRSNSSGISMRVRLLFFLLVLVFTMISGIIVILLATGSFSAGLKQNKQLIRNELAHESRDISEQYGQLSVQAVDFSRELSKGMESKLNEMNLPFSKLSQRPKLLEEMVSGLYDTTYYSLQKSGSSGAFFILDTTVNPNLSNAQYSKTGLYLKNMEPNIVSSSTPEITLLRGFANIGRKNSVDLHTQWSLEFNIKDAEYYSKPMQADRNDNINLLHSYYWSKPITLPNTSEEVMLCVVPIMNSRRQIYGVCGFEVSTMLFKLTYMPNNSVYSRMFCLLAPISNDTIDLKHSLLAGGYSVTDIAKKPAKLIFAEKRSSFTTYRNNNGDTYIGFHTPLHLYPKGSPYSNETWVTAVLVPKSDIVNSITRLNIALVCLLTLLVTIGVIISIVFSNKYIKPISQGIEIIKSTSPEEAPKTNVQEIDDLIHYLSLYKNEVNRKAEQEKHQISVLEQFVTKTKSLTPAERSVFDLYVQGFTAKEIAGSLFLSINTIKTHTKHIFFKLGITSREELLLYINMLKEIGQEFK